MPRAKGVFAHVNLGHWIVICPRCNSGLQLPRGMPVSEWRTTPNGEPMIQVSADWVMPHKGGPCLVCRLPLKVKWPDDVDLIDAALSARPMPVNRNWYPKETVADLIAENKEFMEVK